ncbi:unnamed protein product [Rangifer tarandus platyrhynchus]|uniref:Uncharacterized protein n=2 Tax=Rangifer tarandus platyrhynchus TaxID=3082113 RepID=A0ACB0ENJ8_RANTA|nr:unnamed protein product [Rangifer tarandus platyrhynchus]CAI9702245.1 unnamed protein product [Rangifer tarandus platyrhynchus]
MRERGQNAAAIPAKTQRPRARISLSPASAEGRVPGTPVRDSRASPAAAAPALRAPEGGTAHAHAHARERRAPASPVPRRRRRRARAGARESEREAGTAGGAGARERRSCIRSSAPKPRPGPAHSLLPRAGSARPNPRACARVRRPGPSGGGPVDSNESVARSRINPFPARPFRGPVGFRACASRRRAFPLARTAHAREGGGAGGGVRGRLDILCPCRRRAATIRDVHDFPPTPPPPQTPKKKKNPKHTATHRAPAPRVHPVPGLRAARAGSPRRVSVAVPGCR